MELVLTKEGKESFILQLKKLKLDDLVSDGDAIDFIEDVVAIRGTYASLTDSQFCSLMNTAVNGHFLDMDD
jgi:hypothetical protein